MIDVAFRNINKLFVLSFKNSDNDPIRNFLIYILDVIRRNQDFNALIENKPFCDQPVKNKQGVNE